MSKLCIISQSLSNDTTFSQSFNNTCTVKTFDYDNRDAVFSGVDYSNITHLALFYHFRGDYEIPFLRKDYDENKPKYDYFFFGNELIDKIKEIRDATSNNLIVDLVSCSLNIQEFKDEVDRFESEFNVNVRYSVDNTGNNPDGNWVLESDNVNIKDLYFTSNIDSWTDVLTDYVIDSDDSFFNDGSDFSSSTSNGITTIKLLRDVNWESIRLATGVEGYNVNDVINLLPNTVFDGSGYTITINNTSTSTDYGNGLFIVDASAALSTRPVVKNLTIDVSGTFYISMFRSNQKFFEIDNCTSTSNCRSFNDSGIIGGGAAGKQGDCLIKNSTNNGDVYGGGFVGESSGLNGKITIINCINNGDIYNATGYSDSGGIASYKCGWNGEGRVINCTNNGNIIGTNCGGIVGSKFAVSGIEYINGFDSVGIINNCKNTGNITGNHSGGITGSNPSEYAIEVRGYREIPSVSIKNCSNTGDINGTFAGGIVGSRAGIYNGDITIYNCYSTGGINGSYSGGIAGDSFQNGTIDRCYYVGDISNNTFTGGILGGNVSDNNNYYYNNNDDNPGNHIDSQISITNSYCVNTNSSSTSRNGILGGLSDYYTIFNLLVSHCYSYNCEYGVFDSSNVSNSAGYSAGDNGDTSSGSLTGGHVVINNFYTDGDYVCNLLSGTDLSNQRLVLRNCYSSGGSGSNPKYGTSSGGNITGNFDYDGITSSSSFDTSKLNDVLTLSYIQALTGYNSTVWSTLTPPSETDLFVYDDGILLSIFQSYPWSGYTAYNSTPSLQNVESLKTITNDYTVGDFTIETGSFITTIFSNATNFRDWFYGGMTVTLGGDNSLLVPDVSAISQDSSGNYTIGESDMPLSGTKGFVSEGDVITIQTDDGNVEMNAYADLGTAHIYTIGGSKYTFKTIYVGSIGFEVIPVNTGSGGDPHIIPLGDNNKVYDLPCKHGENYQYLAYKKHGESVVVNVMTQIVSFNAPKNKKLSKEIEEFISSCRDYVRYVYVCYSNSDTGVKEEICYDLFKLKCVSTDIKNFDTLAYNCRLPVNKKSTKNLENIKLHKKVLKNRKVIGYKTNNKEEQFITVYTGSSKFDIMVGQAKNNLFGTYMSVEKYPQDVFVNGGGLLVHPTKTRPITCLKSGDKQERTNNIIVSRK